MEEKQLTGYPSIDKPWLKNWPAFLLEGRKNYDRIIDNIRDVWTDPDETIINFYDTQITAKEFFDRVCKVAKSLHASGVKEGDSIAVSLESVPEFMELFLACELLGCSVKSFLEIGMDNVELISTCSADIYFTKDYISGEDVEQVYSKTHVQRIVLIDPMYSAANKEGFRPHIHAAIKERYLGKTPSFDVRNMQWHEFLKIGERIEMLPAPQKGNVLYSAFTSGTTGKRKEVMHTSESTLGVIRQIALLPPHEKPRPKWMLAILPPTLVAAIAAAMCYPLIAGKQLILDPFCRVEDLDLELMHFKPNGWAMIPYFLEALLDSKRIPDDYDLSHWVQFGVGAEPLTIKLAQKVQAFFEKHNCKAELCNSYGMSEAGSGCTIAVGKDLVMTGTSGIPYIETIMSIFEPGTSKELKYGEVGEICKAGPGLMKGYADPELTEKTLKLHPDGQIWLHTGDFGFMTEHGLLFPLGRNVIHIYPDKVVFPLSIEEKVLRNKAVKDAIIISGNDAEHEGFENLYLFVVPEAGYSEKTVKLELDKHIKNILLPEESPAQVFVLDKKPIRGFKTDRKYLKEQFVSRIEMEENHKKVTVY